MSRDYKFRGKRTDNGTWEYGDLITWWRGNGSRAICDIGGIRHDVDPETVGQYTGKRVMNGIELFDGDICHVHENEHNDNFLALIIWNNQYGKYDVKCYDIDTKEMYETLDFNDFTYMDHFEVIGNSWINPELLGVE